MPLSCIRDLQEVLVLMLVLGDHDDSETQSAGRILTPHRSSADKVQPTQLDIELRTLQHVGQDTKDTCAAAREVIDTVAYHHQQ
jgi:hypothetical protein